MQTADLRGGGGILPESTLLTSISLFFNRLCPVVSVFPPAMILIKYSSLNLWFWSVYKYDELRGFPVFLIHMIKRMYG